MIISVLNHTNGKLSDEEVQEVLRAINCQIEGDFAPYWSLSAMLRLEGKSGKQPSKQTLSDSIFLTQSQLDAAKGDTNTKLPPLLARPTHWSPSGIPAALTSTPIS